MVRFKNRYLLLSYEGEVNEKQLMKGIKAMAQTMMGDLFLAKIVYSLQIKYMNLGLAVVRVARDHCTSLVSCIFPLKVRVLRVAGTIRSLQRNIYQRLRKSLKRELNTTQKALIEHIDHS